MEPTAAPRCACDPTRTFPSAEAYHLHRQQRHGDPLPADVAATIATRHAEGKIARTPRLVGPAGRVPEFAPRMPWVKWPRDPEICDTICARIETVLEAGVSDEERTFWSTVRDALRFMATEARNAALQEERPSA